MKKINYEPNIDILRGISIILVVLYHLKIEIFNINILPGGYLGVDIFFLISGYLITSILYLNLKKKKFDLKIFFLRRFTRIFPVYIFVISITLILSFFLLIPNQMIDLAKSSVSSILFYSNIFFWNNLNDYYNPDAILNPLLHTWSLAIEIQFYLIFPVLFIFFIKFKNKFKLLLFFVGISSLFIAILFSYIEPQINFFGFQSRLWEFLFGSLIFFLKDKIVINLNFINKNIIYLLIILFAVFFDSSTKHPSYLTLIMLIFVSLIILDKNKLKHKKNKKILLFFGLISYSLYLWHYPILSLSERIIFNQGIDKKFNLIILSIFLSYLSYFFLEKKLKKDFKITIIFSFSFLILSVVLVYSIISSLGYPERLNITKFYKQNLLDIKVPKPKYNQNDNTKKVLVIGNSHSVQTYQGFLLNQNDYQNFEFDNFHIQIACLNKTIFQIDHDPCKGRLDFNEKLKFKKGINKLKSADIIILSTRWTSEDLNNLENVLELLKNKKKKVIIFNFILDIKNYNNLNNKNKNSLKLVQKNYLSKILPYEKFLYLNNRYPNIYEIENIENSYYSNIGKQTFVISTKLKEFVKIKNIPIINLNDYICNHREKKCNFKTDEMKPIYYDTTGHLTMNGAKFLFKKIKPKFIQITDEFK